MSMLNSDNKFETKRQVLVAKGTGDRFGTREGFYSNYTLLHTQVTTQKTEQFLAPHHPNYSDQRSVWGDSKSFILYIHVNKIIINKPPFSLFIFSAIVHFLILDFSCFLLPDIYIKPTPLLILDHPI